MTHESTKNNGNFPWWKCECGWIGRSDSTAVVHSVTTFEGKEVSNTVSHQCPMCMAVGRLRQTNNPFVGLSALFGDDEVVVDEAGYQEE